MTILPLAPSWYLVRRGRASVLADSHALPLLCGCGISRLPATYYASASALLSLDTASTKHCTFRRTTARNWVSGEGRRTERHALRRFRTPPLSRRRLLPTSSPAAKRRVPCTLVHASLPPLRHSRAAAHNFAAGAGSLFCDMDTFSALDVCGRSHSCTQPRAGADRVSRLAGRSPRCSCWRFLLCALLVAGVFFTLPSGYIASHA